MSLWLDAGCGNRMMWKVKNIDGFIYTDKELRLARNPSIFCDNKFLPFRDGVFDGVFFDPPFVARGKDDTHFFSDPRRIDSFYGWNIDGSELVAMIYHVTKEFRRVVKSGGLLFGKWGEVDRPVHIFLSLVCSSGWIELMRLPFKSALQISSLQSYWIIFCRK